MSKWIKEFFQAFAIGVVIFIILWTLALLGGNEPQFNEEILMGFVLNQMMTVALYFANRSMVRLVYQRWGDTVFQRKMRMFLLFVFCSLATLVTTFIVRYVAFVLWLGTPSESFFREHSTEQYLGALIISLMVVGVFMIISYYRKNKESQVTREKVKASSATAQFDALKNQLDPHFLFNSLNVLSGLIEEDPEAAQQFTTDLSKVYRYVLEQKEKNLVTLEEEVAFARTYMSLLKGRFEEGISFSIPEHWQYGDKKVVPLSLQLLLENAVKHNTVSKQEPLRITLEEHSGYLYVSNNFQPKGSIRNGSGVGLANIKQRYALLSDLPVLLERSDKTFKVGLPLLSQLPGTTELQQDRIYANRYMRAKKRVEAIKGFYTNAFLYCLIIPFLAWVNWKTVSFPWVLFPALSWGFGLTMHGLEVFGYHPFLGKNWEQRKLRELMEKDR